MASPTYTCGLQHASFPGKFISSKIYIFFKLIAHCITIESIIELKKTRLLQFETIFPGGKQTEPIFEHDKVKGRMLDIFGVEYTCTAYGKPIEYKVFNLVEFY